MRIIKKIMRHIMKEKEMEKMEKQNICWQMCFGELGRN
jgi:hypothetical protein